MTGIKAEQQFQLSRKKRNFTLFLNHTFTSMPHFLFSVPKLICWDIVRFLFSPFVCLASMRCMSNINTISSVSNSLRFGVCLPYIIICVCLFAFEGVSQR